MTEKQLERYLKVKALAERGSPGEKEAAQGILKQLEARYQGIAAASAAHEQRKNAPQAPVPTAPPGRSPFTMGGNWENLFRYAYQAYQAVNNVAEAVSDANHGARLAEDNVDATGYNRKGALFVRLRFPLELIDKLQRLNPLQREAFRQVVHDKVEEYLDVLLED